MSDSRVKYGVGWGETIPAPLPPADRRDVQYFSVRKLDRMTGIAGQRLIDFECGLAVPHGDEIEALAKALRVAPELLRPLPLMTAAHIDRADNQR